MDKGLPERGGAGVCVPGRGWVRPGRGCGPGQWQQSEGGEGWGWGDTWSYALDSKSVSGENWERGCRAQQGGGGGGVGESVWELQGQALGQKAEGSSGPILGHSGFGATVGGSPGDQRWLGTGLLPPPLLQAVLSTSFLHLCLPGLSLSPTPGTELGGRGGSDSTVPRHGARQGGKGCGGVTAHAQSGGRRNLSESSVLGAGRRPSLPLPPGAAPAADRVWVPGKSCPILFSVTAT